MGGRNPYKTNTGVHIQWFTVRRNTVYSLVFLMGLGAAGAWAYYTRTKPDLDLRQAPTVENTRISAFLELKGTVKVRRAGSHQWQDAHQGMTLGRGDTIQTARNSEARVRLPDGTVYTVHSLSILIIENAFADPQTNEVQVEDTLTSGRLQLRTPGYGEAGSPHHVATPTTNARFEPDTEASVEFDRSNQFTEVRVLRGRSSVRAGGEEVELRRGQGVDVPADRKLNVFELPRVPSTVFPPNRAVVPPAAILEFRWRPVEGASKYYFVLGRSPSFPDPILQSTISSVTILQQGLEPGTYYWHVLSIDSANRRSAPSDVSTFTIEPNPLPPPSLTVETPTVSPDGLVTVSGRTDTGAILSVDYGRGDDRVDVNGDGSFTYYFQVREAGRHPVLVRARSREGGAVAEQEVYAEIGTESQ